MKRLIAVLVVVALVMTGAFAQISFGAWGRGMFVPVQKAAATTAVPDPDVTTAVEASWGGQPRIGFTIRGTSNNIGFQVDMTGDVDAIAVGDNAKIFWANDMFKVNIGKVQGDALRGKFADAPLGGIIFGWRNKDNDNIFTRFYPTHGALVEVTPVDGLYIGASVDTSIAAAKVAYKESLQAGIGYSLDGIGHIRAQYVGSAIGLNGQVGYGTKPVDFAVNPDTGIIEQAKEDWGEVKTQTDTSKYADNGGRVEVAFAPTFIDGVALDIGAKLPLDAEKMKWDAIVAAGAAFNIDAVSVTTRVDATINQVYWDGFKNANLKQQNIQFYAVPSMGFDFGTIGFDAVVEMNVRDYDTFVGFGVAPWYSKGYANGYIKAAVAVTKAAEKDAKLGWAVPVIFEYWF